MSPKGVRWAVAGFFLVYTVAVTWPAVVPFNRIRPLVFGLPFSLAWMALWVSLGFVALLLLDRSETREENRRREDGDGQERDWAGRPERGRG